MKKILPTLVFSTLLIACSQNNQPPKTDETNTTNQAVSKSPDTQSIYAPYTEEAVKAKLNEMQMIIDNGHVYLPAEVKEAESYINGWNKYPDVLKAMMETDLDPNNTQEAADIPLEDESAQASDLNVKARISARESQSAFNVQGAIEYILEIQSTSDQPFILQGMKINRGRCGYYTADFHSKMPVQMSYSSTVSYLLKCRGDQVLEAELITDQGNVSLSF